MKPRTAAPDRRSARNDGAAGPAVGAGDEDQRIGHAGRRSEHRVEVAQRLQHRAAAHIVAVQLRVGDGTAQLVMIGASRLWIALVQDLAVAQRLRPERFPPRPCDVAAHTAP